ncbi:MAG TPA: alpha/beta hydrolase-fold protein [Gemmatimonadales bacterium]|jgi:esterase/lipase superfamily enzyme
MQQRDHLTWNSPALLGRQMDLLVFGNAGERMLAFPTSCGSYHQWADRKMPEVLAADIDAGRLQLFCAATNDAESWYDESLPLAERAAAQGRFDDCLRTEVLPRMAAINPHPVLVTVGASFGGYHAINFALRHPELVSRVLSMSGVADIRRLTHGETDGAVYFQNPAEYIPLEHDAERLAALRRLDIVLAIGRDDPLCSANEQFSIALWERGIGNALRIWDGWAHDWPFWEAMLRTYVRGHD